MQKKNRRDRKGGECRGVGTKGGGAFVRKQHMRVKRKTKLEVVRNIIQ